MARTSRNGHLRCSDAERERVADHLRDHAAQGRLTHDELADRVGFAYRAVTVGDLERLTADLPGSPLGAVARRRSPGRGGPVVVALAAVAALAALVPWSMWLLSVAGVVLGVALALTLLTVGLALAPFALMAAAVVYAVRRIGDRGGLRPR